MIFQTLYENNLFLFRYIHLKIGVDCQMDRSVYYAYRWFTKIITIHSY